MKYCKIVNNQVVEANVLDRQVAARNDNGDYREQVDTVKPIENEDTKAVPVYTIEPDKVIVGWVLQQRTDAEKAKFMNSLKTNRLNILKENFAKVLSAGKVYSNVAQRYIDARLQDLSNINSLIKILPDGVAAQFRCADNSFVDVTKEQLIQMEQEIIQYGMSLYQQKWTLEQQINAATTTAELREIDLSFGIKEGVR